MKTRQKGTNRLNVRFFFLVSAVSVLMPSRRGAEIFSFFFKDLRRFHTQHAVSQPAIFTGGGSSPGVWVACPTFSLNNNVNKDGGCRVVSSEISGNFLRKVSKNLFYSFRIFVNYLCQSAVSKSNVAKWCCKISMFLTNNSPDLYALTLCIMFWKNN